MISQSLGNANILSKMFCSRCTSTLAKFETVFSLPTIKYISLLNRLKVYHLVGTSVAVPSSGLLEMASLVPDHTFLTTSYIGLTAAALLSLATLPFSNIIGFLYISEDKKLIKISSVNFWGKRIDRIVNVDDWIPMLELPAKTLDPIYLSPQLSDGTKYKLFLKFGNVLNEKRIGEVLE
ncbi:unnamed protein product [Diatraea saccharalis]|uniref:Transmembrane protein 186 n=1 Tax=Diatraea saccharalis TaxID=40085 RepID=A0A9N9WB98_9NEOP|nr:unnamed protein product [Diatraea saccharalis]